MINKFSGLASCAILSLTLVGSGCASNKQPSAAQEQQKQDRELAGRVNQALRTSPIYKYNDVSTHVASGTVHLSGFVSSEAEKEAAAREISKVPGVARVENELLLKQLPHPASAGAAE